MELEGLKRGLRHITELNGVQVHDLVTDRHVMIKSYMKTERPNMNHYFDVWHVAKGNQILNFVSLIKKIISSKSVNTIYFLGISKKLETAAKGMVLVKSVLG